MTYTSTEYSSTRFWFLNLELGGYNEMLNSGSFTQRARQGFASLDLKTESSQDVEIVYNLEDIPYEEPTIFTSKEWTPAHYLFAFIAFLMAIFLLVVPIYCHCLKLKEDEKDFDDKYKNVK